MQAEQWENPYISDGLVFYVDGINKGNISGEWTDLIGGITFVGNNVTATKYGWSFNGNTSSFYSTSVLPNSENYTVEICFKPTLITSQTSIFSCGDVTAYHPMFYWANNVVTFLQRANTYSISLVSEQAYSISLNLDSGFCNGQSVTKRTQTDYWGNTNFWIGRNGNGRYFNGEIYCIRIYDRKLSQMEQLFNFNKDVERFELNIQN